MIQITREYNLSIFFHNNFKGGIIVLFKEHCQTIKILNHLKLSSNYLYHLPKTCTLLQVLLSHWTGRVSLNVTVDLYPRKTPQTRIKIVDWVGCRVSPDT